MSARAKKAAGDAYREWFWKNGVFNLVGYQFYKETQILAPGMDAPANYPHNPSFRQAQYDSWLYTRFGR